MFVKYVISHMSTDENIQKLAVILGKLENKAIAKLIDNMELHVILSEYLTAKEQDIYYKSRFKLRTLLNQ